MTCGVIYLSYDRYMTILILPTNSCLYPIEWIQGIHSRFRCTLPGLPGLPSAPGRFRPGTSADLFGFGDRKSTNTRMGPAKVPQPGVNLIYMVSPARSLARAVSTPEFEGLLLSRSVLVWNDRRGIAMKKEKKERHPPKKVLCPANVESRDRWYAC